MRRYELTNEEWERIKDLLPPENTGKKGRPGKENRVMLNGMLWITRSGSQWRNLPDCYGPWESVYARFRKWQETGMLEEVFRALSSDRDMENLSIDSTSIRVHESANGNKKGLKARQ
jgi:transposase